MFVIDTFINRDVVQTLEKCVCGRSEPVQGSRGLVSQKSYIGMPAEPLKFDFLYTIFLPNYPPINILFLTEKHPIEKVPENEGT